jgi:23S rRNA (uracil1939-C5)-methyltransferase
MNEQPIITLTMDAMAHGGAALGKKDRKVYFVPYTIPGETVKGLLIEDKKNWARLTPLEILQASPERVTPRCPHFGLERCGGCQWQHISYDAQVKYKQLVVIDQLERLGHIAHPAVRPTLVAGDGWAYRNNAQFHAGPNGLGFISADGQRVEAIDQCPVLHPALNELLGELNFESMEDLERLSLRIAPSTGERMIVFETANDEPFEIETDLPVSFHLLLHDGTPITLIGSSRINEIISGQRFSISAGSFFQVNSSGAEKLVSIAGETLQLAKTETLLDLYCGVGLFSIALASQAGRVIGIEENSGAVQDARFNTEQNDIDNADFIAGKAEAALEAVTDKIDAAIIDPPRGGCAESVLRRLVQLKPKRILHIGCDPATLARDAARLTAAGYRFEAVQPVDLFPQTYHVETVVLMSRH